jgi:hypothetical protein
MAVGRYYQLNTIYIMETEKKHPFEYQAPTEGQTLKISELREGCKALYELLKVLPDSREKSLAITKLEEVSMWANKAVVFN